MTAPWLPWAHLSGPGTRRGSQAQSSSLARRSVHEEVPPPQPWSQGAGTPPTPEQGQGTPPPPAWSAELRRAQGSSCARLPQTSLHPKLARQALTPRASRAGQPWLVSRSLGLIPKRKEDASLGSRSMTTDSLPSWAFQWLPRPSPVLRACPPLPGEHRLLLLPGGPTGPGPGS